MPRGRFRGLLRVEVLRRPLRSRLAGPPTQSERHASAPARELMFTFFYGYFVYDNSYERLRSVHRRARRAQASDSRRRASERHGVTSSQLTLFIKIRWGSIRLPRILCMILCLLLCRSARRFSTRGILEVHSLKSLRRRRMHSMRALPDERRPIALIPMSNRLDTWSPHAINASPADQTRQMRKLLVLKHAQLPLPPRPRRAAASSRRGLAAIARFHVWSKLTGGPLLRLA